MTKQQTKQNKYKQRSSISFPYYYMLKHILFLTSSRIIYQLHEIVLLKQVDAKELLSQFHQHHFQLSHLLWIIHISSNNFSLSLLGVLLILRVENYNLKSNDFSPTLFLLQISCSVFCLPLKNAFITIWFHIHHKQPFLLKNPALFHQLQSFI